MTDHAAAAQKAAEDHLDAVWIAFDAECCGEEDAEWPEDMAGPFDGCRTCEVREVLHAAYPHLLALAREEAGPAAPRPGQKPDLGTGVDTVSMFELDELAEWRHLEAKDE